MQLARLACRTLGLVLATSILVAAQSTPELPDALNVLKNVELTYRGMTTYSATSTSVMEMNGPNMQQKMEVPMTIVGNSSGKMRMESTGMTGVLMVYDGSTMWMYMPVLNKYSKLPLSSAPGELGAGMSGLGSNSFLGYQGVASNIKEAKVLRSEKVHFNGSDVDCWVVSVEYEPLGGQATPAQTGGVAADLARTKTLWVDKVHYLVYREDSISKMTMPGASAPTVINQSVKFESIAVDQVIPEGSFTFVPLPGATEMDLSSFMPNPPAPK